ncbi:MAG TPA: OmpA family protein [Cyclobacteriaceae bacterium]|nr:OmpA family protein [Cyclobacteriaceae bacterium]
MKKSLLILSVLVGITVSGACQSLKDLISAGDKFYSKKNYSAAIKSFTDALSVNPDDAAINFKLGLAYLYSDSKSKAAAFIDKAYRLNPAVNPKIDYYLGIAFQNTNEIKKAIQHFEDFKKKNPNVASIANEKIAECHIADSLAEYELNVVIENLGPVVNSRFTDHSPILSADGNILIFTSNRPDDPNAPESFEDVYVTDKYTGEWSKPKKISKNINTKFNDAAASLSPNGKTLFLYSELGGGDIYFSNYEGNDWTEPKPLNKNINTSQFWETCASVSPDGKKLYFASNRDGGFGELDIYVSELDGHGEWGKAINLGDKINTPGNEDSPFIHFDGVTLYFSSDGHPGLGNSDIFFSELKKGQWTKPENIGYPINLWEYDGFFSMARDKKTGYYSTVKDGGLGGIDIYSIKFLEPKYKPKPPPPPPVVVEKKKEVENKNYVDPSVQKLIDEKVVTILRGKVIDENTAAPLNATVTLVDNETGKVLSKIYSDPTSGDFELHIPHGGNYGVTTESVGYLFNSINFNLPKFAEYQEIDTHIIMVRTEIGSKVVLRNIFFDVGKFNLKDQSVSEVQKVQELLAKNPQLKVQINGHTDNTGDAASNKSLSLKRANAVVDYLISKGVDQSKVSAKGYGSERPIVSNDDESGGREVNRRTEIEVVGLDEVK